MNIIITVPFDNNGRHQRQILVRGVEITDKEAVTVDLREYEHHVWTPSALVDGLRVEFRER